MVILLSTITFAGCGDRSSIGERIGNESNSSSTGANTTSPISPAGSDIPQQKANLPAFTLFKDSSYEDAGTAKVIWEVLLPPEITKESLSVLLNDLYSQAQAKKFRQHNQAVVIDIKAFMSRQHAESGMGQWIGWMSKLGGQSQPYLSFDDRQINQLEKGSGDKFGLTENKRKEVWQDAVRAEDRVNTEAEQKYPEPSPQNRTAYMEAFEKRDKLTKQLINKYHNELAKKHGLTRKQLDEIRDEGLRKSWPFPN